MRACDRGSEGMSFSDNKNHLDVEMSVRSEIEIQMCLSGGSMERTSCHPLLLCDGISLTHSLQLLSPDTALDFYSAP